MPTLPLGIDLGTGRIRIALLERGITSPTTLRSVVTRELRPSNTALETTTHVAKLLAEMLAELGTSERRCFVSVCEPEALVRRVAFPKMSRAERERAARFEAMRFVTFPVDEAHIRVLPIAGNENEFVVGVARRAAIERRLAILKLAKLRPVAIDHDAFAWRRAVPQYDALLDLGFSGATLHVFGSELPYSETFELGGEQITQGIARSLGIDRDTAERRKRTLGLAGAGEAARDRLLETLATAFIDLRASGFSDVRSLGLAGNGARLTGIVEDIEAVTAVRTQLVEFPAALASGLPPDVTRAAAPDWMLAYGLALHGETKDAT